MKIELPDNINLGIAERYILTVYVHPEKFSFSLHCPDDLESYFFYKIDSTEQNDAFSIFKDIFFENDFFNYPFQRTCILVFSPLFTYVPNAIYSEKYKEDFIRFIFSEKAEIVLDHDVPLAKLRVLYPVSEAVYDFFIRSFNEPEFVHYSAPLIIYFYSPDIKQNQRQLIVNMHEKGIDIFCFSQKSFLLGNHFPCEKFQDALYFILYTWKQLKLKRFTDSLYVAGELHQSKELIDSLRLYLQQVHLEPLPDIYRFGIPGTNNLPFELAIFSLCGL
ncbi:MAG: DUF3822 family protein [Dysgonamonadaceae bacterium]|jgi:hypothetical protein|nr:DUF3822 family protein [Dysgonamonadaceae bacterium]